MYFFQKCKKTKGASSIGLAMGLSLTLVIPGTGQANFLFPQIHHPGEFFEKYAPGQELPFFNGVRVDGTTTAIDGAIQVSYEEFRQRVLADTFYDGEGPFLLNPMLPPYNEGALVWGYSLGVDSGGNPVTHWPGNTIEAERGIPTQVSYVNNLPIASDLQTHVFSIDQTIHWANPLQVPGPPQARLELPAYSGPQPVVSHLHGAEVPSSFDGSPDQWYTSDGIKGSGYRSLAADSLGKPVADNEAIVQYPNGQEATTLWFHDHTLGITRINVYAGVAAYYLLRDPLTLDTGEDNSIAGRLPAKEREIEFVIQDRMFDILGNLLFPDGLPFFMPNAQHPFWNPEFLGDVSTVNGKAWPFVSVDPQRYRIRLLNGSNARFYNLSLDGGGKGKKNGGGGSFWIIGTDGGLLDAPVKTDELVIAPGERYDIILDFAGQEGKTFTLKNDAKAPYPFGGTANPQTIGQIAQFRVSNAVVVDNTYDPSAPGATLRGGTDPLEPVQGPVIDRLVNADGTLAVTPDKYRLLTLNEIMGPFGPLDAVLNNTFWGGVREDGSAVSDQAINLDSGTVAPETSYLTEMPELGSTEVWEILNLTGDAHPIHLHLVQFQVLNRQGFNQKQYDREYLRSYPGGAAANPNSGFFIPHFGPPLAYNDDQCLAAGADCLHPGIPTIGGNPLLDPFLSKSPIPAKDYEAGWKDTVIALPKQVTRIAVRFAKQDWVDLGKDLNDEWVNPPFSFDATAIGSPFEGIVGTDGTDGGTEGGPGYVWHCHIIDHEDNEMMRPYVPVNNPNNVLD